MRRDLGISDLKTGPGGCRALVVAVESGLLVGPVMPADVVKGTAQETSDWLTRTVFFAGIGAVITALMRQAARGIERERQQVASAKRLDDALRYGQSTVNSSNISARNRRQARWSTR